MPEKNKNITLQDVVQVVVDLKDDSNWYGFLDDIKRVYLGKEKYPDYSTPTKRYLENVKKVSKPSESLLNKLEDLEPSSPEIKQARDVFEFILPVYVSNSNNINDNVTSMIMLFINKVSKFTDDKLVYDAISLLKDCVLSNFDWSRKDEYSVNRRKIAKEITTVLANNKNAGLDDIYNMMYVAKTPEELGAIEKDIFGRADECLEQEMSKDVPNFEKIQNIISTVHSTVKFTDGVFGSYSRASDEFKKYVASHKEGSNEWGYYFRGQSDVAESKYDFDKIVGFGGAGYIEKYNESAMEKVAENEKLKSENQKLNEQNTQLTNVIKKRDEIIEDYQKKFKKLHEAYNEEINNQKKKVKMLEAHLKLLESTAVNVRGGLGAKGVKELQAVLDKIKTQEL